MLNFGRSTYLATVQNENVPVRVLEEDPFELLKRGEFHRVPTIIGSTADDGQYLLSRKLYISAKYILTKTRLYFLSDAAIANYLLEYNLFEVFVNKIFHIMRLN